MQLCAFRLDVDGGGGGGGVHLVIHLTLYRSNEEKAFFKNSIEGFVRSFFCVRREYVHLHFSLDSRYFTAI